MYIELTEEQKSVQTSARDFAETILLPGVIDRDTHQRFFIDEVKQMGEMGFMGMMVDPQYGGGGLDAVSYTIAMEEISKVDASASVCMSVNNSLVCAGLDCYGSIDQKERYLRGLASGKSIGAFCLSEPEAGSDATSIQTSFIREENHYVLNGVKNWVTNGNSASVYIVIARDDQNQGYKGINAFIVDKASNGLVVGSKEDKMGIRGSDTHSLLFTDVRIPVSNRIGNEGTGFQFAMNILSGGRIGIAAQALGIASGAYERALHYAKERKSFNKFLCEHQAIRFKLADMATKVESARLLVRKAAYLKDQGKDYNIAAAKAKLFSSKIAQEVTSESVQIHGGYGYVKEFHVERMMRDAKITQIYEGTSEIQKMVIARALLRE